MAQKKSYSVDEITKEFMRLDRLRYLEILRECNEPLTSYEITERILISEGIGKESIDNKLLRRRNPPVNTRLKTMEDMGILRNEDGRYSVDFIGQLFFHAREKFSMNREILEKHRSFFETHNFHDIPEEFRWQIYKLRNTEITVNIYDFIDIVQENLKKVNRKIYLLTEYLHDIPDEVIQKIQKGETDIAILYQCDNPPRIEREDEKELLSKLTRNPREGIEFRFLPFRERFPLYVNIVDEQWAIFALSATASRMIDRNQAFFGTDIEFVMWCRDLLHYLWWEKDVTVLKI